MNLFCPIRKKEVVATPEERVRASFIQFLIQKGFPKELILVETALSELPHIKEKILLDRRVDILCYNTHLKPLLLVECKVHLDSKHMSQVLGYNHFIQAPFLALVSSTLLEIRTGTGEISNFKEFPSFYMLNNI